MQWQSARKADPPGADRFFEMSAHKVSGVPSHDRSDRRGNSRFKRITEPSRGRAG